MRKMCCIRAAHPHLLPWEHYNGKWLGLTERAKQEDRPFGEWEESVDLAIREFHSAHPNIVHLYESAHLIHRWVPQVRESGRS